MSGRSSRPGPGQARLSSRNGNDVTGGYPEIVDALAGISRPVLLDGELVALDGAGRPDFGRLQQRMHVRSPAEELRERVPVSLYVFDLLVLDGQRLLGEPFDVRREALVGLGVDELPGIAVPPSFTDVTGAQLLQVARSHRLEGVVAKRRSSRYEPGRRSTAWVKTALLTTQEVLIGGWTAGEGRRRNTLGALLLGARDRDGRLRYLGNVGTGFTEQMLRDLLARLAPLARDASPFADPVPREHARGVRWVSPRWSARSSTATSPRTTGCGTRPGGGCGRTAIPRRSSSTCRRARFPVQLARRSGPLHGDRVVQTG